MGAGAGMQADHQVAGTLGAGGEAAGVHGVEAHTVHPKTVLMEGRSHVAARRLQENRKDAVAPYQHSVASQVA